MTTAPTHTDDDLGDRLRRLAQWADRVPPHTRAQLAVRIDALTTLLGQLCADTDEQH